MNYGKILRNFSSVSIKTGDFLKFFNINMFEAINHYEFLELINLFPKRIYIPYLNSILLTSDGLYFDLKNIKEYISSFLDVPLDENTLNNLAKLDKRISKMGMKAFKNRSKKLNKYYNAYIRGFIDPTKTSKINFCMDVQRIINLFRKLLLDESKFSKVCVDSVTEQALDLFVAYKARDYYKYCEERNLKDKMAGALTFLTNYLSDNVELINSNYTYNGHRIKDVYYFVSNKTAKNVKPKITKPQDEEVERYSYSFLECDVSEASNTIGRMLLLGENSDNDEKLKVLLRRKIELYQNLNYRCIKVGIDSFNGYIGFALNNGYVVLDKLFDNLETGKIASDEAIYVIREDDFELVTKSSKRKVIELINTGAIKAERIIHSGSYELRVRAISNR